jgi:hypothetical protein
VDVSKHSDLAQRIFRTVVFSGAMLGGVAPALADQPVPPKQGAPVAKAETWAQVSLQIDVADKKVDAAILKVIAAHKAAAAGKKNAGELLTTSASDYEAARDARTALDARLAKTTRPPFINDKAAPDVEKTEKALADADAKLHAAVETLQAAEGPDPKPAIAAVESARKSRVTAAAKVRAARAKANRRPRAQTNARPTGRGFILS